MNTWSNYIIIYRAWVYNIYGLLQVATIEHDREINCTQMRVFVIFILKVGG